MRRRFRSGGLAAWSVRRPVAVVMLALAVVVMGLFSLERLAIDLLPHIIYPEVRVRVLDPGVPARIMEDRITRQLEEQLAITEDAIAVQSTTSEGRSSVDLSFPYGTDIDRALRDASTRLDRAKRFLPDTIEPPIIYKRDPSQIPILELAVSSTSRESASLRDWVDYDFAKWFLNLPGVAAAEVGGGREREIQIQVDPERLASQRLGFEDIASALTAENEEYPGGRVILGSRELSSRATGRIRQPDELGRLPLNEAAREAGDSASTGSGAIASTSTNTGDVIRIQDVARVLDTYADERLRVRLDGQPAVKVSIQKQPSANTVAVVEAVRERLDWMQRQKILPPDIHIATVSDQSVYIRHALNNAVLAVILGAILAMLVVYLFLGDLTRTLIIGLSIPLAILVTFIIMALSGLTLNIMTLGALAVGVGMLVDNTIVMLENITRHQQRGEAPDTAPVNAAAEINSAIVASTSTNLAAILPFLFIGGLVGLLFSELIITLSAAVLASLLVAITLVPALGARSSPPTRQAGSPSVRFGRWFGRLQDGYARLLDRLLQRPVLPILVLLPLLVLSALYFITGKSIFLPSFDEGRISISVVGDSGTRLDDMDQTVRRLERMLLAEPEVRSVFTTAGGFIFGRSEFETSTRSGLYVQLQPRSRRTLSSSQWVRHMQAKIRNLELVGYRVRMRVQGIRGFRLGRGDDDISLRIQGPDLDTLGQLGSTVVERLRGIEGLRNLQHSYEDLRDELVVSVDRTRAGVLGIDPATLGLALQVALDGRVVSDYIEGDRQYPIRMRLPRQHLAGSEELENLYVGLHRNSPVRLRDVADLQLALTPNRIQRDNQRRIVEISASLTQQRNLEDVMAEIDARLADLSLPEGYTLYEGGLRQSLQESRQTGYLLLALALFLVYVVMAVQYESLRNPLVIMLGIPFASIGVAATLWLAGIQLSMTVWLGLIMLAGIVVNNAIVLVEQIEIERGTTPGLLAAVRQAARIRLRPILMTTLTTAMGMLPLALGLGEGSEMLQPLAIVIVSGLLFSMLVSLLVIPALYLLLHGNLRANPAE